MIAVNNLRVNVKHFPAGEQNILDFTTPIMPGNEFIIRWHYENDEELVTLIYIVGHLRSKYPEYNISLDLPYMPHARMDRTKNHTEVFTLKYFAQVINSLNFNHVNVWDAHSDVSVALLDRVINHSPNQIIAKLLNKPEVDLANLVIYFPDAGAYKRYKDLNCIQTFKLPCVYGEKIRNWETHRIEGLKVVTNGVEIEGKDVLMIDDIISYGGTFFHSAKKLRELGALSVSAYATHVENEMLNKEKGTLVHAIEDGTVSCLYTTDSIFNKNFAKTLNINIIHSF